MRRFALALDQGGSFCDVIAAPLHDAGETARITKRPRAEAADLPRVLQDFLSAQGIAADEVASIRIATTLPTNALLAGTAAPVVLVTNRGFTDLPDLGRQSRRDPDALDPPPPTPPWLSPPEWRFGVGGRIAADGSETAPVDEAEIAALMSLLPSHAPVAVCLLHAHRNPAHERRISAAIGAARAGAMISLSHRVDPSPREFERMLATLADAALKPMLATALGGVAKALREAGLPAPCFGRADGGASTAEAALDAPLPLALSGPAAGALAVARWAPQGAAIGLDMGGTTAEVSLVREGVALSADSVRVGAMTLRCAALDVESVALGGDRPLTPGGPTLTDAARAAGWLAGEANASSDLLAVAAAMLAEATRRIALRRNIHPDVALLVAGGGFGPLVAADVAERMGCRRVLVPPAPGLLAATGLLDTLPRLPTRWTRYDDLLADGTATLRVPPDWRVTPRADGALLLERDA